MNKGIRSVCFVAAWAWLITAVHAISVEGEAYRSSSGFVVEGSSTSLASVGFPEASGVYTEIQVLDSGAVKDNYTYTVTTDAGFTVSLGRGDAGGMSDHVYRYHLVKYNNRFYYVITRSTYTGMNGRPSVRWYRYRVSVYAGTVVHPTVTISPASNSVAVGTSVVFTASGGQNGYTWGGSASGSGNTKSVTFGSAGTYQVTVMSPAGNGYAASNTATAIVSVTVPVPVAQTVTISPASRTVTAGDSVTFTASGGKNDYTWGGLAGGNGTTKTVTFNSAGTYQVTVMSPAGNGYAVSNTATATITVNEPPPTLYSVSVTIVGNGSVAGGGTYAEGTYCTLTPQAGSDSYFAGFSGDQNGPGATAANPSPGITFLVTGSRSVTALFLAKLDQTVVLQNPGSKPVDSQPFAISWSTDAGTTPTFSISGVATINSGSGLVSLAGGYGNVTVTASFPGTFMYLPATASVTFAVGVAQPGVVIDVQGSSIQLSGRTSSDFSEAGSAGRVASAAALPLVSSSDEARVVITATRNLIAGVTDPGPPPTNPTDPTEPAPTNTFPENPTIGQLHVVDGVRYLYTPAGWQRF